MVKVKVLDEITNVRVINDPETEVNVGGNVYRGMDGATFTPNVTSEGVISWTNDADLPNPEPRNIRGPQGIQGPQGERGPQGIQGIQGIQGVPGKDGADGKPGADGRPGQDGRDGQDGSNGATFTPSVNAQGVISWTNDGGLPNPQSQNIKGPQGDPGPNIVTGKTETDIEGVFFGKKGEISGLPVDATPTSKSPNLVESGGVYDAIDETKVFWATYGSTTFAELTEAWNEGKMILCYWSSRVYRLIYKGTTFTFGYDWGSSNYRLACDASSTWSNTSDSMYVKPSGGIPKTDLASGVQTSLEAADAALPATGTAKRTAGIYYAEVDSTSTSTAFTVQIPGVTEYYEGLTILLYNGVVTSASGYTININGLGAYGTYSNMAMGNTITPTTPTRDTTIFNINYAMLMVFCSDIGGSGTSGWICYRGYDANTNTIGYQVRTNSYSMPMTSVTYRYRLLFESADHAHWVPATNSTSTNATSSRSVCQDKIDIFGKVVYYGTTASVAAGSRPSVTNLWQIYAFNLGYSFQKSTNYSLTSWKPVYLVLNPQTDGSAIIDSTTPITQTLPNSADGKLYKHLGVAYNSTNIELSEDHAVYYYTNGRIYPYYDLPPATS